jgi:hypothetical protein
MERRPHQQCGHMDPRKLVHAGTGIFANAFADQWISQQNDPASEDKWVRSEIIQHIIDLCGFSVDSLMVLYMDQQQWSELEHVVMTALDEIKDFATFRDNGFTYEGKPMIIHQ